jgi:hypothetical protein
MLFPFHGYLLGAPGPTTSATAAARARRIRDGARRYQPGPVMARAVAEGILRSSVTPHLYRYSIIDASHGREVIGLVGEVPVADLVPHERTLTSLVEPAPLVEIRPILVVTRAPLPRTRVFGRHAVVAEGGRRHEVAAVQGRLPAFEGSTLVIADGHHRTRAVRDSRGDDSRILAMVIGDSGRGLAVGTFHRRFHGVGTLPVGTDRAFEVTRTERRGVVAGALLWVQGSGERFLLTPRPEALDSVPVPLRGSAAAIAAASLYPLMRAAEEDAQYVATVQSAVRDLAPVDAALLMPPVPMETVLAAADSGTPFPPKGTRFAPKPVRGIVVRVEGD